MPLDPLLANPTPVKFADPLEQYTNLLQAQHLQSEIQKARRAEEDDNATNAAFKTAYASGTDEPGRRNALFDNLAKSNRGKLIPGFQKQFAETDKSAAEAGKFTADTSKANVEATAKEMDNMKSHLEGLTYDPHTDQEKMFGYFKSMASNPVTSKWIQSNGQTPADYLRQNFGEMMMAKNDPNAWKQYAMSHQLGAAKAVDALRQASENSVHVVDRGALGQTVVSVRKYGTPTANNLETLTSESKTPRTTINVNNLPENKAGESFGTGLGKMTLDEYAQQRNLANGAGRITANAQRIRDLVKNGAFTGAGSEIRTKVENGLAALGFTPDPNLSPTQELQKYLAANVFDQVMALKASGAPISRLTNMELQLAERASAAQNMTPQAIDDIMKQLINLRRENTLEYNGRTREFQNNPHLRSSLGEMSLHELPIPGIPPAAIAHLLSDKGPNADKHFDEAFDHPGLAKLIRGGTSTGGAPFNGLAPPGGGGGGLAPVAPGFAPTPWGTPNPAGGMGPLGRPSSNAQAKGNTPQTEALKTNILQHYPGAQVFSEYRSPEHQMAVRRQVAALHGMSIDDPNLNVWVAGPNGSHTFGTALDVHVGPKMREQFKADMRRRGLRAYDEGSHVHVDDRTDLPNGPSEGH